MTNFDFLLKDKRFESFGAIAVSAEKLINFDIDASVIFCRRALEFAVKWMYSADDGLSLPYQDSLVSLINTEEFRDIVSIDVWRRIEYIRKLGNLTAHSAAKIRREQADLALENLFVFLDFIAYLYTENCERKAFDRSLLAEKSAEEIQKDFIEPDFEKLKAENAELKRELTERRKEQEQTYVVDPLNISEFETRKNYIDVMLADAGWVKGKNLFEEVELAGMPNSAGVGYADYVLFGDDMIPLAVLEAKKTCIDVSKGRQQAKLYADLLEQKYKRRPVIFLSNGFDTTIEDNIYPERKISFVYGKRDLEKLFNLQTLRIGLNTVTVNPEIAGRYYQEGAIKAVCDAFMKNRRKALLVMATGSGKTRTVIALCDVLLRHGWVKNILFLADRTALVTQAKRAFVNLLPDLSVTNLCEDKDNYNAHCVFSTYQTMINCIDEIKDEGVRLYTTGHFDLIICDEAHRSIYNKYKEVFTYFDAPLVGLTATPKDEIEKNTYEIFELENKVPTYAYDLAQAVKDGYLVDYVSVESKLKFIEEGIVYSDLSEEDKEAYEETFKDEDGEMPESIASSALNEWIFNDDTIKEVLNVLMVNGLKIDYGSKIGKTIIFAKNHKHAEKILEVFNKQYPEYKGFAKVIDNYVNYSQSAIDEFSDPAKLPQIAISVDMLDTGIDIPEILNLVFFKKVLSIAKFWQMIGRGTRLCSHLIDGEDKSKFYIFDFCGNFEFFRANNGKPSANMLALQGAIFNLKVQMIYKLQDIAYQTEYLIEFRKALVADVVSKIRELNKDNFAVRQHLKTVEVYSDEKAFTTLTYENTLTLKEELSHLITPYLDEPKAVRFDALIYGIELAYLSGKKHAKARSDLMNKVAAVASVANVPEIMVQSDLINKILHTSYLETADINDFEIIRENIRNLIKYIPPESIRYDTDFDDELLSIAWNDSELDNDDLKNYKAKAEFYIRQHQNDEVIAKLKSNVPLNADDVKELEKILWNDLGTKNDYETEFGKKPLGEFVREIVGLDMNAAKTAFAKFLHDSSLNSKQIYFVNQIVEYIVHNGVMKDLSVLQEAPFTDEGSIVDIFEDINVWYAIKNVIDSINQNAVA